MAWPDARDFADAVQNARIHFSDNELRGSQPVTNAFGLPQVFSGNFSSVIPMECGTHKWAVKCFTRYSEPLAERYPHIVREIEKACSPWLVPCDYQEDGLRIRGAAYPILKVPWLDGICLNEFIDNEIERADSLANLALEWLAMLGSLRENGIAHGDLQPANVFVLREKDRCRLRLLDYDAMFIPAFSGAPSLEIGSPSWQHPKRGLRDFGPELDRFSGLAIYTMIRALAHEPGLWKEIGNTGGELIFSAADYRAAEESQILNRIRSHPTEELQYLGEALCEAACGPPDGVPDVLELPEVQPYLSSFLADLNHRNDSVARSRDP